MLDIAILNGRMVDGANNPWVYADIGIKNGNIVNIAKHLEIDAELTINAKELIVCPGFIDLHDHSDVALFRNSQLANKFMQGVTTNLIGLCGFSAAPVTDKYRDLLEGTLARLHGKSAAMLEWNTMKEFLDALENLQLGVNIATFVGHGTVRVAVLGMEARAPNSEELNQMKLLVDQAMNDGAYGLTSGLIYPPGVFAETNELIELTKVVCKYGGIYCTHPRNMNYLYIEAINEAIETAEKSGVSLHISHIQAHGMENWEKVRRVLHLIDDTRARGLDVTGDAHPYLAASTFLTVLLPPWTYDGGPMKLVERLKDSETRNRIKSEMKTAMDYENMTKLVPWENIIVATYLSHPEYQNKSLAEISQLQRKDPYEALFDVIIDGGTEAKMIVHAMNFEQKATTLAHPEVLVISDSVGVSYGEGKPHPRCYGTYPRVLREYVREKKILRLETAIHKMTAFPAHRLGLRSRGLLKEGMAADIVIFNPELISDTATYEDPHQYPKGIEYVLINGKIAVAAGQPTGISNGKVLRRGTD